MTLLELGLLGSLLMASHEGNHAYNASKLDVPLKWNKFSWNAKTDDNKKLAQIGGAGFEGQDIIEKVIENKDYNLLNALHKLSYLIKDRGDINTTQKASGNRHIKSLLLASALVDIYKSRNPKANWSLNFSTFDKGAPGLLFTKKF